jgi:predicted metal-dependent phosphoesterase TrpH
MGRADLHVHSHWSDGAQSPETLVRRAAGRLDVLALTDHDEIRGALEARAFARSRPELGVEVVVGAEITTRNGHLLGLFLDEPVPPGLPVIEAIRRVHAQGGLAVAAHPCHPMNVRSRGERCLADMMADLPLDAVEIVNNAGYFSWLYDALAALRNVEWAFPVTGGSDAHDVWYLGSGLTRFEGRSAHALREALAGGRTRAQVRWRWTVDKAPRHLAIQLRSLVRFAAFLAHRQPRPGLWNTLAGAVVQLARRPRAAAPAQSGRSFAAPSPRHDRARYEVMVGQTRRHTRPVIVG